MKTPKPRAYVANIFGDKPISVQVWPAEAQLSLPTAKKLLLDLSEAPIF